MCFTITFINYICDNFDSLSRWTFRASASDMLDFEARRFKYGHRIIVRLIKMFVRSAFHCKIKMTIKLVPSF